MAEQTALALPEQSTALQQPSTLPEKVTILAREGQSLRKRAEALAVVDVASHAVAADIALKARALTKVLKEIHDPNCREWDEGHKRAVARRKADLEAPETAAALADRKAIAWEELVEAERKAAEEAARKEQERLEAAALAEAEAEQARLQKAAEDTVLDAAVAADAMGDHETAERLMATPVMAPIVPVAVVIAPPVVAPALPKVGGYVTKTRHVAVLESLDLVIQAAAKGNVMARQWLSFDQAAANRSATKGGASPVPGVKFEPVKSKSGRA